MMGVPDRNGGIPEWDGIPDTGGVPDMVLVGYHIGMVGCQRVMGYQMWGVVLNMEWWDSI